MTVQHSAMIILVPLLFVLSIACYTDLKRGMVYNSLTLPSIILGIALNAVLAGVYGMLGSILAVGLVLALSLLPTPLSGIGGGDRKLMMAVAAFTGLRFTVWAMLFSAIAGGVLALIVMIRHRILAKTVRKMGEKLYCSAATRQPIELSRGASGIRYPYSPAIAVGTLVAFKLLGLGG